jgi:stalled ribosome rescue protein Dom34
MAHSHAVVWLDSRDARIFSFNAEDVEKKRVKANEPHRQVHHRSGNVGGGHVRDNREFFEAVLAALEATLKDVGEWLVVGPGETKREFEKYVRGHAETTLAPKLVGIGPMDHPSDNELVAAARKNFKAMDRLIEHDPRMQQENERRPVRG